jgi:hypothetical protein
MHELFLPEANTDPFAINSRPLETPSASPNRSMEKSLVSKLNIIAITWPRNNARRDRMETKVDRLMPPLHRQ